MGALAQLMIVEKPGREETLPVARADFEGLTAIALRNESLQQPTDEDLALAREKANAVKLYKQLKDQGLTRDLAANRIRALYGHRFPLLSEAGQGGGNAIKTANLDYWQGLIRTPAGALDYTNVRALVRDYAKGRKPRKGDPRFWPIFGATYLVRNGPGMAEAYRLAVMEARRQGIENLPSKRQVSYWYERNMDQDSVILARQGEDAFAQRCQYFIDRDWAGVQVGEMWISDHHTLDCAVRHWDEDKQCNVPKRCTLTAIMDGASLYFAGWRISVNAGNNDAIQDSIGLAIITQGMTTCDVLYIDNGADYRMIGFDDPLRANEYEHSVLRQLGIEVIHSIPYRAQAKIVERRFGEVCEWFSKTQPCYLGNKPGMRSEVAQYLWEHPDELPNVHELTLAFARWLAEVYHQRPSNGKILQGRTPQQAWDSRPDTRVPWTPEQLRAAFLMPARVATVQRGPMIRYDNRFYFAPELRQFLGQPGDAGKVLVKRDRMDDGHIYCFHFDGRPICEARTRDKIKAIARTPEEREQIAAQERLKRHQRNQAFTAIQVETGGTYKLSSIAERLAYLEQPEAHTIERVGERKSVKGGSHRYVHHRLAPAEDTRPEPLPIPTGHTEMLPDPTRAEKESADSHVQAAKLARVLLTKRSEEEDDDDAW